MLEEILLDIGLIKMRITGHNLKSAPNLALIFPLSSKMNLIRLTPYHWQPAFRTFVTLDKNEFAKFHTEYQTSRSLLCKKKLPSHPFLMPS